VDLQAKGGVKIFLPVRQASFTKTGSKTGWRPGYCKTFFPVDFKITLILIMKGKSLGQLRRAGRPDLAKERFADRFRCAGRLISDNTGVSNG
jgi:hypothetical protein